MCVICQWGDLDIYFNHEPDTAIEAKNTQFINSASTVKYQLQIKELSIYQGQQ